MAYYLWVDRRVDAALRDRFLALQREEGQAVATQGAVRLPCLRSRVVRTRDERVAWRVVSNATREMPRRDGVRQVGGRSDVIQWLGWASSGPLCSAVVVQRSNSELSGKISSPPTHSGGNCEDF